MDAEARRELANEERERALALAERLLPEEVARRIAGWKRLTIAGTDTLGPVPFAWLPIDGERLGARVALVLVPTLPFAASLARRARSQRAHDLVLLTDARPGAATRSGEALAPVGAGAEVLACLRDFYGEGCSVLTGDMASSASLGSLPLDDVAVLQLLVHAVEEPERSIPVSLVLTPSSPDDDGLFRGEQVASLDGAPRVVLLTACGSGQGPTRRGDPEVGSLTGAWLAHGAQVVITAGRELTLSEAKRVTALFHERLRAHGDSPAEAMRVARVELLRAEPDLAPFLHGMLQVVGAGHEPVFAARAGRRRPLVQPSHVAAAVLGLGLLLVGLRRRAD